MKLTNVLMGVVYIILLSSVLAFALDAPFANILAVSGGASILLALFIPKENDVTLAMKILWGAGVVDGRGKLGGWVGAKNRGGNYFRVKTTPVNPQTLAQQLQRANFGQAATLWRTLTEAQRSGWITLARNTPYRDIFGNSKTLSGISMFVKVNSQLMAAGQAQIDDAPLFVGVNAFTITGITADASTGALNILFPDTPVPAGHTLLITSTPGLAPGINFFKNQYRIISAEDDLFLTGGNVGADFIARYGALTAGQKLALRAYLVNNTTGEVGVAGAGSTIVVA